MLGKVVGVMEISRAENSSKSTGHLKEYISGDQWARVEGDKKTKGKWHYAIGVSRAWKIIEEEWKPVEELFPSTYSNDLARTISVHCRKVDDTDLPHLKNLNLYEVKVYGQTSEVIGSISSYNETFQPSNAVPPARKPYWIGETNGPKHLYIMRLIGNTPAYLGIRKEDLNNRVIIKVGYSKSPLTRLSQIQANYPSGSYKWEVILPSPIPEIAPYLDAETAIKGEDAMKAYLIKQDKNCSLGGEFFLVTERQIKGCWLEGKRIAGKD